MSAPEWDETRFPREKLGSVPGTEPARWFQIQRFERLLQEASKTAFEFAATGGKRKKILGERGKLERAILWASEAAQAEKRVNAEDTKAQLRSSIDAVPANERKHVEEGKALDQLAQEAQEAVAASTARLATNARRQEGLSRLQQPGRSVKVEAGTAAIATGTADAGAFILTLNGVGGAEWIRYLVAFGVVMALNVAVLAGGRLLDGLWGLLDTNSRGAQASFAGSVLVALLAAVVKALLSAGDFRTEATANVDRGLPTSPEFLVWIGVAAAIGSMVAIAFWHYSSVGNRLAAQRQVLEAEHGGYVAQREELRRQAKEARQGAIDAIAAGRASFRTLQRLDEKLAHELDVIRARTNTFLGLVETSFEEGKAEMKRRKQPPTFGKDLDAWLDAQIASLFRDVDGG
jgi:hypothetical protein